MAAGDQSSQWKEYERIYLAKLEVDCQRLGWQTSGNNVPGLEEIGARINLLRAWEEYLETYEPLAKNLLNAGLPEMSRRLSNIRSDLHGAAKIYSEMYQDTRDSRNQEMRIQQETDRECQRIIQEVIARRQQVFENCMKMRNLL
jgi:hypothetical protein